MKKITITINGKPFTYEDELEDITYKTISAISQEDARDLLQTTKRLFDECGMKFVLAFGTLLGAVRDGNVIPGDEDVDVFVESEEELRSHLPYLQEHGLKLCRIDKGLLYSFRLNNKSFIDVYIRSRLSPSIWSLWCYGLVNSVIPKWLLWRYDTLEFLDGEYLCPHKPERILKFWYGSSWRIPIKSHIFKYDTPFHFWWKKGGNRKTVRFFYHIFHPLDSIYLIYLRIIKRQ